MDDNLRDRFRGVGRGNYSQPEPRRPVNTPKPQNEPVNAPKELADYPAKPSRPASTIDFTKPKQKPKKSKKKIWIFVVVFIVLLAIGGVAYRIFSRGEQQNKVESAQDDAKSDQSAENQEPEFVRLVATGDMIAHNSVLENGKKNDGSYDFLPMMKNMQPYFEKAQVRFCNQATPAGGSQFGITGYPIFNAPIEWARSIEAVGCNVINIGTNHTNDKGQPLVDATVAAWDGRQDVLAVVGANRSAEEQAKIRYFNHSGIKFSILSYSTYTNNKDLTAYGVNMYSTESATKQVSEARKNSDIVLVSMRWGTEYSPDVNAEQEKVAKELADAGADVIFGHGPHFMQPAKIVKRSNGNNTFVWYSLGNFLNTQLETEALIGGFAVMDINAKTKQFVEPAFLPTYMHYDWTEADKKANNLSARKNLQMYVLDQASEPMSRSQLGTTVQAQTQRVTELLNKYTRVKIMKSSEY